MANLADDVNVIQDQDQLAPALSYSICGIRGQSTVYIDEIGFHYYQHSIRGEIRYLTCANRRYSCPVSANMQIRVGSPINISANYPHHNHEPAPRYAVSHRNMINRLRERAISENTVAHRIVDEEILLHPEAEMDLGRPAAVRLIARARRRVGPPIPETLMAWMEVLRSEEWGPRLNNIDFNGSLVPFFQGPLEILNSDNTVQFVGIVFANVSFLSEISAHFRSVNTICMDGTFQIRPRQPADIDQIFTIQIIVNNVAVPIVHALLLNRRTETYCRLLQFLRDDLQLNIQYNNLQVITDFEQGLRNAITRVLPEANNSGCFFHFIQAIIRFVRSHQLQQICTTNENARRILRMLMALAHLPGNEIMFHGNLYSIQLGFRFIQDLVADYGLEIELRTLMNYFERFWMDTVTPQRFTVCRLQHRTNNFIESYHASLLRLMGQRPQLYRFYDHLRTVETRARNDFNRAINGQRVRQSAYRIYPHNDMAIRNAWVNVENGRYTLEEFLRNVSYTPEQIIRNELGEPNFEPRPIVQAANIQLQPRPPQLHRPLVLGPLRQPPPLIANQPIVLPLPVQQHHFGPPLPELRPPSPELRPPSPALRPQSPQLGPPSPALRPQSPQLGPPSPELRPPSPALRPQSPQLRPPSPALHLLPPVQRREIHIRGRGRRNGRPYHLGENRGRGQIPRGAAAEAWAWFYREDINNEQEPDRDQEVNPRMVLNAEERHQDENEEIFEICIICCEEISNVVTIPCRHRFCRRCIERWMQGNNVRCPLCRSYINMIQNR
ncbi:unnamed protein product [Macrosiphum euphorbiae]|uniref:RING-type domain-containing protein n=1 Tax=Macrosiphum euphorbiae TaxID=13131 RepID=A0AAV0WZJ6_9HEMI|nr:unnamed protein product [Macrosiphum euphorbiae]